MLVYFHFPLHLFILWLASRFMEYLRMNLASYKLKILPLLSSVAYLKVLSVLRALALF